MKPMEHVMIIEVGKSYRTRDGRKIFIFDEEKGEDYPLRGQTDECLEGRWLTDGRFFPRGESSLDLISEWEDEPELKEGTVHLGDHSALPSEEGHTPEGMRNQTFEPGMSLRDYFAAKFLAGAATSDSEPLDTDIAADQYDIDTALFEHWRCVARVAYIAADAMLAAREATS